MPPNAAMRLAKEMPEGALRRSRLPFMAYHAAQKHGAQYTDFSGEVCFFIFVTLCRSSVKSFVTRNSYCK